MIQAVIFDMDGVLCDSEPVYDEAVALILGRYGVNEVSSASIQQFHGIPSLVTWSRLRERYGLSASAKELELLEREYVEARSGEIPPVPFAFDMMRSFRDSGMKIAVATSNYGARARAVLKQYGAEALVDAVASMEDVARAKPAPDIFLLAAERLCVPPERCAVIEDSLNGVKAAKAANMRVARYANPERAHIGDCGADTVLSSFEGVTIEKLAELMRAR